MLLRRLGTRVSHTTRTASSQSWSTASRPTHSRLQIPYKDARLQFRNYGKQQHSSKAYSNYAPRGPSQYYGAYSQPPNSRASRLKDMAIGSALTIAAYLSFVFFSARQLAEENAKLAKEVDGIYARYEKLLRKAEMDDDGSPESAKEINRILRERMLSLIHVGLFDKTDTLIMENLGSLPRFPEGHQKHGSEMVKDRDTSVYMLPPASKEDLARVGPEDTEWVLYRSFIITVKDTIEDLDIDDGDPGSPDRPPLKLIEIGHRSAILMDNLVLAGELDPDRPILITFLFRDGKQDYVYKIRRQTFVRVELRKKGFYLSLDE